jgi:16S rRNA (guanine527-N7)-methyltransferase
MPQREEVFLSDVRTFGISLSGEQQTAFRRYCDFLLAENRRLNLTAITTPPEVYRKHFLDSLSGLPALPADSGIRLIDVGTGAGFPGLPLKIARPDLRATLLEATRKKAGFLRRLIRELALEDVIVVWGRAETVGRDPQHREQYDVAVARAVAPLPALVELLLPFCRVGGICLAWKGPHVVEERAAADAALKLLGGRLRAVEAVRLPGDIPPERYLVVVDKVAPTPNRYPRRPGIPTKRPLGGAQKLA